MKQFIVDRHTTPNTPKMDEVPNEKIPIYDSLADAEADLANLEKGQIGSTKDTGAELSQPVDVVESGNLHAVTSNAVVEALGFVDIKNQCTFSGTSTGFYVYKSKGLILLICDRDNFGNQEITLPSGVSVIIRQVSYNIAGDYFFAGSTNQISFVSNGNHYVNLSALFAIE
jgi:hypothetical protein